MIDEKTVLKISECGNFMTDAADDDKVLLKRCLVTQTITIEISNLNINTSFNIHDKKSWTRWEKDVPPPTYDKNYFLQAQPRTTRKICGFGNTSVTFYDLVDINKKDYFDNIDSGHFKASRSRSRSKINLTIKEEDVASAAPDYFFNGTYEGSVYCKSFLQACCPNYHQQAASEDYYDVAIELAAPSNAMDFFINIATQNNTNNIIIKAIVYCFAKCEHEEFSIYIEDGWSKIFVESIKIESAFDKSNVNVVELKNTKIIEKYLHRLYLIICFFLFLFFIRILK